MCVCVSVSVYTCVIVQHKYICTYVCVCVCILIIVCTYVCVYVSVYTCVHAYTTCMPYCVLCCKWDMPMCMRVHMYATTCLGQRMYSMHGFFCQFLYVYKLSISLNLSSILI